MAIGRLGREETLEKCVAKHHIVATVASRPISASTFTKQVAKSVKDEVEKSFLKKANIEERFIK